MRLLIATLSLAQAERVCAELYASGAQWDIVIATDGLSALHDLLREGFDLLLLHACLPKLDGLAVLGALREQNLLCPPRVLFLSEPELFERFEPAVDCAVPFFTTPDRLCMLLRVLAKKPLPMLAAANRNRDREATEAFLNLLSLKQDLKGRAYASWLICRMLPSPAQEEAAMGELYTACAQAHHTTPAAVERCLRLAVENVFTQGNLCGIERFFGATVDPERGKPTNRAFLLQAVAQLRLQLGSYSLADVRSPKSNEMHQSPAAPTNV